MSSALLDFGTARATFTVSTQLHPSQRVDVVGTMGEITVHLPFNAWTDVPLEVTVTTPVGRRTIRSAVCDQYVAMFEAFSGAIRSAPAGADAATGCNRQHESAGRAVSLGEVLRMGSRGLRRPVHAAGDLEIERRATPRKGGEQP